MEFKNLNLKRNRFGRLGLLTSGVGKRSTSVKDEATSTTPFLLRRGGAGAFYGEGAEALNPKP